MLPQKYLSPQKLGTLNILGPKKKVRSKKIGVTNFVSKNTLGPNIFGPLPIGPVPT